MTAWTLLVDIGIVSALLLVGKLLRAKVRFIQKLFVPPSLLAGFAGLVFGPELLDWLDGVRDHELSRLPWAIENAALFQGRCQVLSELSDMLRATPAMAAKV